MKKILSIITAASIAIMTMLSAVTVTAAEKITAEEVKEMICSAGLQAYPELWNKAINEVGVEADVLNPDTRTVKDIIDVDKSYREFYAKKDGDKYSINYDDNIEFNFTGLNKDGKRVMVTAFPENYVIDISAGTIEYYGILNSESELSEDYQKIAEIINNSGIGEVRDIKIVNCSGVLFSETCVYIENSNNNKYAIPIHSYTDSHAESLGRETKSIESGEIMDFNEFCCIVEELGKNMMDYWNENQPEYEVIEGDEIRDTDTRAAYIGTESKFSDVSGDLVSYVNELYDLGIINGYNENLFMPENNITRAEASVMLARMLKYSGKYSGEFKDVTADDWFADDVSALTAEGVINGYSETEFAPYENIKYQEIMKILVCALGYGDFRGFGSSAYPLMTNQRAMEIGLTKNLQSFDTTACITRRDMAVMLSNALDTHLFTTVEMIPQNGIGGWRGESDITLIDYLNGRKLNGTLSKAQFD